MSDNEQHVPPNNLEVEKALLGSVLVDSKCLYQIVPLVERDDFYSESNRIIYETIAEVADQRSGVVDLLMLVEALEKSGKMDKVGGYAYVAGLTDGLPGMTELSISQYCNILKEKSSLRNLIRVSQNLEAKCYSQGDPQELIEEGVRQLTDAYSRNGVGGSFHSLKDLFLDVGLMESLFVSQAPLELMSGFEAIDGLTHGFHPGELALIAARPSVGKTGLALNIACNAMMKGATIPFFSAEMSKQQLMARIIYAEGRVDSHRMRTGFGNEKDETRISEAVNRFAKAKGNLYIDDSSSPSVLHVAARVRALAASKKIHLVIADYLQLLTAGKTKQENRNQEVTFIGEQLKNLARVLDIPVIALAQLNRAPEIRGRGAQREPQLSDLRESGSLEQTADVVIFLWLDKKPKDAGPEAAGTVVNGKVAKQRNGPTGPFKLVFLKSFTRFENYTPPPDDEEDDAPSKPKWWDEKEG